MRYMGTGRSIWPIVILIVAVIVVAAAIYLLYFTPR